MHFDQRAELALEVGPPAVLRPAAAKIGTERVIFGEAGTPPRKRPAGWKCPAPHTAPPAPTMTSTRATISRAPQPIPVRVPFIPVAICCTGARRGPAAHPRWDEQRLRPAPILRRPH